MATNEIEEKLENENLDFLEEGEAEHPKNDKSLDSKPGLNLNLIKKIGSIGGIIVAIIIVIMLWKSYKTSKTQVKFQPDVPTSTNEKVSVESNQVKSNFEDSKILNKTQSTQSNSMALSDDSNLLVQKHDNIAPISNVPDDAKKATELLAAQSQLSSSYNNSSKLENQDSNVKEQLLGHENLSWKELKKSIDQPSNSSQNMMTTPVAKISPEKLMDSSSEASEANKAITGFELKVNPTQIAQTNQVNQDYKEQQEYIKEIKNIIAHITAELANNTNQIKELQNNILDLPKSVNIIYNNLNGMDAKITKLTTSLNEISLELKNLKKYLQEEELDLSNQMHSPDKDLFNSNPEYVIHAVIPGRAWLKSSSGQIITIVEGDLLGDYGKVALIDPVNNIVRTSSGVVFR